MGRARALARTLHDARNRASGPLWRSNCEAIPETLLEAECFGYEKARSPGQSAEARKFEMAQRGTIFLDEIGEVPLAIQAKMLRAIETKTVRAARGTSPFGRRPNRRRDHRDLRHAVRPAVSRGPVLSTFGVPGSSPVRERASDIPKLAHYFVEARVREVGRSRCRSRLPHRSVDRVSVAGETFADANAIERAFLLSDGDTLGRVILAFPEDPHGEGADPWDAVDLAGVSKRRPLGELPNEKRKLSHALRQGATNRRADRRLVGITSERSSRSWRLGLSPQFTGVPFSE